MAIIDSKIPSSANPSGDYVLDNVLEMIREHWHNGRQIVPLLGAGISVESGIPAIPLLREHLLALHVLQNTHFWWQGKATNVPAYALERDAWVSSARLAEYLNSASKEQLVRNFLEATLDDRMFWKVSDTQDKLSELKRQTNLAIQDGKNNDLVDVAEVVGLGWLELMEEIAQHRPELVDIIFDALSAHNTAGPTHNLLTHCVNWFNIRLLLTTNFDKMVEDSLKAEGMRPYTYDIHLQAPPPPKLLVERHLSVIKLHGNHYGLRADRTVNQPLDRGHMATLLDYLDEDVILLCLGYGGGEKRITGFISEVLKQKKPSRIIRVDPLASNADHFFAGMAAQHNKDLENNNKPRVVNLYYPPSSGLFLLHLYQYVANRLPNTRGRYPSCPYTAAPHKKHPTLGRDSYWKSEPDTKNRETRDQVNQPDPNLPPVSEADGIVAKITAGDKWAIVTGQGNCGTSQVLAQVYEKMFKSHQISWCDLDEMPSVGSVLGWLHDFVNSRQPDLPATPLPFPLPPFGSTAPLSAREIVDIDRAVRNLWNRLGREKFVIILDSLSCAVELESIESQKTPRRKREAARLLLLAAILLKYAEDENRIGQCVLLIGTHRPHNSAFIDALKNDFLSDTVREELKNKTSWPDDEIEKIWTNLDKLTGAASDEKIVTLDNPIDRQPDEVDENEAGYPPRDAMWESDNITFLTTLNKCLEQFICECAFCNRPRSWRQLMQLPAVRTLATDSTFIDAATAEQPPSHQASLPDLDKRSRALSVLVNGAIRRKQLYLQAGGFYYMDGSKRFELRKKNQAEPYVELTHIRMAAFFERSHNQSGDVTALSHYFWHTLHLLHLQKARAANEADRVTNATSYWLTLENCLSRLLENSLSSRGYLYAYDHCFLLLQLWDELKDTDTQLEIEGSAEKKHSFSLRILNAICEVYEDNIDAESGLQAAEKLKEVVGEPTSTDSHYDTAQAYYRLQKAHWQGMSALKAFKAAHHALAYLFDKPKAGKPTAADLCKSIDKKRDIDSVLQAICKRLGLPILGYTDDKFKSQLDDLRKSLRQKYHDDLSTTGHRILFHRIILRLFRSLIRVSVFSECSHLPKDIPEVEKKEKLKQQQRAKQMCQIFILGKDLDLGSAASTTTIKLLTARYHSAVALWSIYQFGKEAAPEADLKMLHYNHQAQARAIRTEGVSGAVHEANSLIDEAEMVLWRARRTLHKAYSIEPNRTPDKLREAHDNAAARQNAAVRHFEAAQAELLTGSIALSSWLEMTVQRTAITADILKRITCQYLDLDDQTENQIAEINKQTAYLNEELTKEKESERQTSLRSALQEQAEKKNNLTEETLKNKICLIAEFASHAEQGAFDLGHLLPLLRDDVWRGTRAGIQLLRISGSICRMIWLLLQLDESKLDKSSDLPPLVVSLNTLIRAVNNFDLGRPNTVLSVPSAQKDWRSTGMTKDNHQIIPEAAGIWCSVPVAEAEAEWQKFENKIWYGISQWVDQIAQWLDRILPSAPKLIREWREFPEAWRRFDANRDGINEITLCHKELKAITENDPENVGKLKKAFVDSYGEWKKKAAVWPSNYESGSTKPHNVV